MQNFGILSTVKNNFVKNLMGACESEPYRKNYTRFNYKTTHVPTGRLSAAGDKRSMGFYSKLNIQNIPKPHPADYHCISVEDAKRLNPELVQAGWDEEKQRYKDVWFYNTEKRENRVIRILDYLFIKINWKKIKVDEAGDTKKWPDDFPFNNEFEKPHVVEGADPHLNMRSSMLPFDDDSYILSLDYSGQELKAGAMMSREPVWFKAFVEGGDAHRETAYAMFGAENYNNDKRKLAKGLNFGIMYGMEAYSIYTRGVAESPEQAEDFYNKFKTGLPVLFNWLESVVALGKRTGTVYTMFGRPRRVQYWLQNANWSYKSFGERTCKNTVIQGTGADITKLAVIKVFQGILAKPSNMDIIRFMSTVHDEVNFSVKKDYIHKVAKVVNKLMTIWVPGNDKFPFDTGLGIGQRWGELFDFTYDKTTFEIEHPVWDALPDKPVEYVSAEVIEEPEESDIDFTAMFGDLSDAEADE